MAEKPKKHEQGFTLAEMLVSIFIIALISSIFFANYRSYGQTSELNMTAQKLAGDLRKMLNYSMGLKEFEGSFPLGGWGLYFDRANPNSRKYYTFFADADENSVCHSSCDNTSNEDYLPRINLPNGFTLDGLYLNGSGSNKNEINLTFKPPEPIISICQQNSSQCGYDTLEIVLRSSKNNKTKSVLINRFGLIDVKN